MTTADNYRRTRDRRFAVQGVKTRHRRKAERIAPGDRVCWYLVGCGGFVATATVTSPAFEDRTPIWVSTGRPDPYPWRFRIARDIVRDVDAAVSAASLAERLAFTRRWPRAHWRLAFQGNLHEIGRRDFALIERALAR
ncbi:MAG: EVE domain-containing protein [Candidatus Limnocylindria bacterium]